MLSKSLTFSAAASKQKKIQSTVDGHLAKWGIQVPVKFKLNDFPFSFDIGIRRRQSYPNQRELMIPFIDQFSVSKTNTTYRGFHHHLSSKLSPGIISNNDYYKKHNMSNIGTTNAGGSTNTSSTLLVDFLQNLSPREKAKLEEDILNSFSGENGVLDPILKTDIRTLGWVRSITFPSLSAILPPSTDEDSLSPLVDNRDGKASVTVILHLPTLIHPRMSELKQKIRQKVLDQIMRAAGLVENTGIEGYDPFNDANSRSSSSLLNVDVKVSAAKPIPFVRNIEEQDELIKNLGPGLKNVCHFLAVYSCKGGVGKSTVAVNLAYELSRMGGRVGLLDVDIYGPSLPVLVQPDDFVVRQSPLGPGMVRPIEHKGVKLLSLGFVSPKSGVPGSGPGGGAAVMRGPMAGRVVTQLLKGTDWGNLDVLVLDMPPGTGDVQLTICQELQLSGAVSVTTPSKVAAIDARKGIEMFTSMGIPTVAAIENMAFFECEGGGRHFPFGKGIKNSPEFIDSDTGLKSSNIFQLPISSHTNDANDKGSPLCLTRPTEASEELSIFENITKFVAKELLLLQHGRSGEESPQGLGENSLVTIGDDLTKFDVASIYLVVNNTNESFTVRFFSDSGASQVIIPGDKLRSLHPKTGEALEQTEMESSSSMQQSSGSEMVHHHKSNMRRLFPCKVDKKGRYGYLVEWGDGATIIYSMFSLAKAAGAKPTAQKF